MYKSILKVGKVISVLNGKKRDLTIYGNDKFCKTYSKLKK